MRYEMPGCGLIILRGVRKMKQATITLNVIVGAKLTGNHWAQSNSCL